MPAPALICPGGEVALPRVLRNAPAFCGKPIRLTVRPVLFVWRGKLRFRPGPGEAVHAASFVRKRMMIIEKDLLGNRSELKRILLHELAHFAWVRLGNSRRREWGSHLETEFRAKVPGECGWSAERRKQKLELPDAVHRARAWREYCCESFCDTAAWVWSGSPARRCSEVTLGSRVLERRRHLLLQLTGSKCVRI
jgi:hypothetical protein